MANIGMAHTARHNLFHFGIVWHIGSQRFYIISTSYTINPSAHNRIVVGSMPAGSTNKINKMLIAGQPSGYQAHQARHIATEQYQQKAGSPQLAFFAL